MTPEGTSGNRRYGAWAGRPKGYLENTDLCAEEVNKYHGSMLKKQCTRSRGFGPNGEYCPQHAKKYTNAEQSD